jgi:hypothetical protein
MTRQKVKPVAVRKAAEAALSETESDIPAAIAAINALSNSDEDGAEWDLRVYQLNGVGPRAGKPQFLFPIEVEELSGGIEMRLADMFPAGGDFRIACRRNGQLFKNVFLSLAARPGYKPPAPLWQQPAQPIAAPAPAGADPVLTFLQNMMQQQNAFMAALVEKLSHTTAPVDPIAQLTQTVTLLRTMNDAAPKPEPNIGLSLWEKGLEAGMKIADRASEGNSGGGILSVLKELATPDVVKAIVSGLQPQHAAQPALAAPPGGPVPQPAPSPLGSLNDQFRSIVTNLMERARAGQDPAHAAEWVLDNVPASVLDMLEGPEGMQSAGDVVNYLASAFPEVAQYRNWFEGLVTSMYQGQDEGVDEAGGEDNHVEGNGGGNP